MKYPSQEYLKECLNYDPESGIFTWKNRPTNHFKTHRSFKTWNSRFSGKQAGNVHIASDNGLKYITIRLCGTLYKAHRLAFLYMDGVIPVEVDHDDGDGINNKWSNLNGSDRVKNCRNFGMSRANSSGVTGVSWNSRIGKWHAKICNKHVGYFDDISKAKEARDRAAISFGFNKGHGKVRNR